MAVFDPAFVESRVPLRDYALAVETGTLFGDGAEELRQHFKEVHTIEIQPQLHAFAQNRFAEFPQVHCHLGDSVEVLRELAPRLLEPTLFFLDAHWSGGRVTPWGRSRWKGYGVETGHRGDPRQVPLARQQAPLDEELTCLYQSFKPPCAIVIDDINLFDEHGRGRKDHMFVGEDWSHLNLNAMLQRMEPRTRLVHRDRTQMLVVWSAAPD
jgi:hypothetical protein